MTTRQSATRGNTTKALEQRFFRGLNGVVEPLVRSGVGSPARLPAGLIVLETTGFRSGKKRRTPLWSLRLGRYRLVATARGERSFWVRNLGARSNNRFYVGGELRKSEAIVIAPGFDNVDEWELNAVFAALAQKLSDFAQRGWAFALLVPAAE